MTKVLVDHAANRIRGSFEEPLNFSISGKFVIDLPAEAEIRAEATAPISLIARKRTAILALHPSMRFMHGDELLDLSLVDAAQSSRVVLGPLKRTVVLPGGSLLTTAFTYAPSATTSILVRWSGFSLYRNTGATGVAKPPPSGVLYNYDPGVPGFVPFDPALFSVDVVAGASPSTVVVGSVKNDVETAHSAPSPVSVRLKFTNVGPAPYHLSDWLFLAG